MDIKQNYFYTPCEVAKILGISEWMVYKRLKDNTLKSLQHKKYYRYQILGEWLNEYIERVKNGY